MSRSSIEDARETIDRVREFDDPWLLSFADMIINLLAFFVVLVSMATISFESIDAIPAAFSSEKQKKPNLKTLSTELTQLFEKEGVTGKVVARFDEEGLAIQIQDRIVFPSGEASLSADGRALVQKIARLIKGEGYDLLVEGHTDDVPIATAQFPSNWELSAARALEVRRELSKSGIADQRLAIKAFADTQPLPPVDGETKDEQRRKNRRVVIRVY
jgi:chemotaxis protein MotB